MKLKILLASALLLVGAAAFAQADGNISDSSLTSADPQSPPWHPPVPPKPPKPPMPPVHGIVTKIVSNYASGSYGPVQAVVDCGEGMVVTGGGFNCTIGDYQPSPSLGSMSCPTTNSTSPAKCDVPNGSSARYWAATCLAVISHKEITTNVYAVCAPAAHGSVDPY